MSTSIVMYNQYEAQNAYQRLRATLASESVEAAIAEVRTFLKMFPDVQLAHNDLGVLYHQSGNDLLALAHYEKANRLQPGNPTVIKNLAEFYFAVLKWTDDAVELLTELLKAWPDDFEILTALGNISEKVGRPDEARTFYRRANELEPESTEVREILARLGGPVSAAEYRQPPPLPMQQADDGLEHLVRQLQQDPYNPLLHNNLGILYTNRGEYEQARYHHEQAVRYEPASLLYQKNLADLYYAGLGMPDEAIAIYTSLIKKHPDDIEVLTALAMLAKQANLTEQARIFIAKVVQLQPWNEDAQAFLAEL